MWLQHFKVVVIKLRDEVAWRPAIASDLDKYQDEGRFKIDQMAFQLDYGAIIHLDGGIGQLARASTGVLQVCIHGGTLEQLPLTIIFPTEGTSQLSVADERQLYHPKVRVLFQRSPCVESRTFQLIEWMSEVFDPWVKEKVGYFGKKEILMLQGDMSNNLGAILQKLARHEFRKWLQEDNNADRWHAHLVSTKTKRVLMTWLFGKAWEQFQVALRQLQLVMGEAFSESGMLLAVGDEMASEVLADISVDA